MEHIIDNSTRISRMKTQASADVYDRAYQA